MYLLAPFDKPSSIFSNFDTILDIGCGTGNITLLLKTWLGNSLVKNVIGLDIDPGMIEVANNAKTLQDSITNFNFYVSDISSPWEELDINFTALESSVDLIFSNMALHWLLPDQREPALRNIFRLLKPGSGWFYSKQVIGRPLLQYLENEAQRNDIQPFLDLAFIQNPKTEGYNWKKVSELVGFSKVSSRSEEMMRVVKKEDYEMFVKIVESFYIKKFFKTGQLHDNEIKGILITAIQKAYGHNLSKDVVLHNITNFVIYANRPV